MEKDVNKDNKLDFSTLVDKIRDINRECTYQATRAVNAGLTICNWLIGMYIHEYELNGQDRADYGEKLIENLAKQLKDIPRTQKRELNRYRLFYKTYPQIGDTLSPQLQIELNVSLKQNRDTLSPQIMSPGDLLIQRLSFSHINLLLMVEDETKRHFYEIESIRGNWSVRELKRQIDSLYYERSGSYGICTGGDG